jgi:hypothetical protein
MTLTKRHLAFEASCRQIIGLTICRVEYAELPYVSTDSTPCYGYPTQFPNLHSVDYSISLHAETGQIAEIFWGAQFTQYDLCLELSAASINRLADDSFRRTVDVSGSDLWAKYIGTRITDIRIHWESFRMTEIFLLKTRRIVYPQDFQLTFSNNHTMFISLAELDRGGNKVSKGCDNLMVTDNEELARQVNMIN